MFHAVIEIPRGSKVKYELDKASGAQEVVPLISTQQDTNC